MGGDKESKSYKQTKIKKKQKRTIKNEKKQLKKVKRKKKRSEKDNLRQQLNHRHDNQETKVETGNKELKKSI